MSDKKRHTKGYAFSVENHTRKSQNRSFKKYIEDIRIQEALEASLSDEEDLIDDESETE